MDTKLVTYLVKISFARDCLKYPDLHRKVIFANPMPHIGV